MIETFRQDISIRRQCELLGLNRSSYYYQPNRAVSIPRIVSVHFTNPIMDTEENLRYMVLIDQQYMKRPFYGSRRMATALKEMGYSVNRKRIQRLMRQMGIQAIYPKPRLSLSQKEHKIYPYLLRDVCVDHVDQVWCADITYIPLRHGFVYLVAILDWYSRFVLSWQLSNTLDTAFCLEALEEALKIGEPEIFNTDQGSQFTSLAFTGRLKEAEIKISMDGRGRVFDNIFIERLWRSLKYEDIYIRDYQTVLELSAGLDRYFRFYNHERPHQALEDETPARVYHNFEYRKTA
jgi:putative transposase